MVVGGTAVVVVTFATINCHRKFTLNKCVKPRTEVRELCVLQKVHETKQLF